MIATQRIEGQNLLPLPNGAALVESTSHPGHWHEVKNGTCDCLGFSYGHGCRHLRAVRSYLNLPEPVTPLIDDGEHISFAEYRERRSAGREW
jgi:hypothetical protein